MNERIQELAKQARSYVADAIELGFPKDQVDDIRDEKFVELIALECARVVKASSPNGMIGVNAIRIHFGVDP